MFSSILAVADHLVYATPDLERTVGDLARRLGVTPSLGGRHAAWGTRNELLALGERTYLEIIGPDLEWERSGRTRPFNLDNLVEPRLVSWVCRSANLERIVHSAEQLGVDLGQVVRGSRARPDGTVLRWEMTDLATDREGGIVPYFINWGDSDHPARTAPRGCTLVALRAEHPDAQRISATLAGLGVAIEVQPGAQPRLIATISGLRGEAEFT